MTQKFPRSQLSCIPRWLVGTVLAFVLPTALAAQERATGDAPVLRLEPRGPASYVAALAFSPDGNVLYAGGWDKVVRVWRRPDSSGTFEIDEQTAYRIPLGPQQQGNINAMALSPDGRWLAVAGRARIRGELGFQSNGRAVPISEMSDDMWLDLGVVYVFDTAEGKVRQLVGHRGPVLALRFAPQAPGGPAASSPLLVSIGWEKESRTGRSNEAVGVARLWNLSEEAAHVTAQFLSAVPTSRPDVAVMRTGAGARDLSAAVAWGVGEPGQEARSALMVWDLRTNTVRAAGMVNSQGVPRDAHFAAGTLPWVGGLVTAGKQAVRGSPEGLLALWSFQGDGGMAQVARSTWGHGFSPMAMAVVARPEAASSAVLVGLSGGGDRMVLRYADLTPQVIGALSPETDLWAAERPLLVPMIAASEDGRQIAVGGNGIEELRVFDLAAIRAGKGAGQTLHSVATRIESAAFALRGELPGIALRLHRPGRQRQTSLSDAAQADAVFDLAERRVVDGEGINEWRLDQSAATDRSTPPQLETLLRRLRAQGHEVTASALSTLNSRLIVAVATWYQGNAELAIYDPATGHTLRECRAHTLPVHSLSFSSEGRLLVSTGDDQQLCVWSLADSEPWTSVPGALPFVVDDRDGSVRVVSGQTADGAIREDDVLQAIVRSDRVEPAGTAAKYDQAAGAVEPGRTLRVRRLRETRQANVPSRVTRDLQDVPVLIVPRVEAVNPLFSLFLTQQSLGARVRNMWQWVGWSPLGPFDASGDDVDRLLGWHFNSDRPETPAVFSRLDQYRDQYRRQGILAQLVRDGRLVVEAQPRPLERPLMELVIPGLDAVAEPCVVRSRLEKVALQVLEIPREQIAVIRLEVDGREAGAFAHEAEGTWFVTLPCLSWSRGRHRLRAVLETAEKVRQHFDEWLEVTYLPPAPGVEITAPAPVAANDFELQATVAPAAGEKVVNYRVLLGGEVVLEGKSTEPAPKEIRHPLKLKEGANQIEVVAWNAGQGESEAETTRRSIVVDRLPKMALADAQLMRSELDSIQSLVLGTSAPNSVIAGRYRGSIVVHAAQTMPAGECIAVNGQGKPLARAALKVVGAGQRVELWTAETLHVPTQTAAVRFLVQAGAQQQSAEYRLRVFRALPAVVIDSPPDNFVTDQPHVNVTTVLPAYQPNADDQLEFFVNGQRLVAPSVRPGLVPTRIPLQLGDNRIEVHLRNGREAKSEAIHVLYRRPPRIVAVHPGKTGESPHIDLHVEVNAPSVKKITRVEVNGLPHEVQAAEFQQQGELWRLDLASVPLRPGDNRLEVSVWNQDGKSAQPGIASVSWMPPAPPPPRPVVQFITPRGQLNAKDDQLEMEFEIRSESPLQQVRLFHDGQDVPAFFPSDLGPTAPRTLRRKVVVSLNLGLNQFQLVAHNQGGVASDRAQVSAPPLPVFVEVERIDNVAIMEVQGAHRFSGAITVGEALPRSHVTLHGKATWFRPDAKALLDPDQTVCVCVNGIKQSAGIKLDPVANSSSRSRSFAVPVILNAPTNVIELELPGVQQSAVSQLTVLADCREPDTKRAVHILIVGVGMPEAQREILEEQALAVLGGTRHPENASLF
ncbi:MAG: hypothetical protein AB7O38_22855, partial [Pirellulaceae bacterium]